MTVADYICDLPTCDKIVDPERLANTRRGTRRFCCHAHQVKFTNRVGGEKKRKLSGRPKKIKLVPTNPEPWTRDPGTLPMRDERPVKRCDCDRGERPCPWIGCRLHMLWVLDKPRINRILRLPDSEAADAALALPMTCVLDVTDQGGATLEEIGTILSITRERVRQIEDCRSGGGAVRKLRIGKRRVYLQDFVGHEWHRDGEDEYRVETIDNMWGARG
jgi:hypothetical protein